MELARLRSARHYAAALWLLSFLFALRVLGQAIQRWAPQSFLPAFDAFQGSDLPYGILLTTQIAILFVMARTASRIRTGAMQRSRSVGRVVCGLGAFYMAVALGRFVIGLTVGDAPAWFRAWIPAAFHVVLAAFVLVVAHYHRNDSSPLQQ